MLIEIVPYKPHWPEEFQQIGCRLRAVLGDAALRIDHIGSTSVPALAAKDIIDVQITVAKLDPLIAARMVENGYRHIAHIIGDHRPPTDTNPEEQWSKWIFNAAADQRPANLHMRIDGY
ncbi:MAG: GrpB family protein, partial [Anaerolineae bacterium]|nr:GrpB family protein [Anaerolineae bacterium]